MTDSVGDTQSGGAIRTTVPSFQYDTRNSGVTDAGPRSTPEQLLAAEIDGAFRSPPVLSDGVAYFGSSRGVLRAVETSTGDVLWSKSESGRTFEGTRRTPALADGIIYYTTDVGSVVARTTDGTRLWTFEDRGAVYGSDSEDPQRVYGSEPLVTDDRVIVNVGDGVYALDARHGAIRWDIPVVGGTPGAPAATDGRVFFSRTDGYVAAAGTASGEPLWTRDVTGGRPLSPTVSDGVVYVPTDGQTDQPSVVALDATDGRDLWVAEMSNGVFGSVTVADGVVYVPGSEGVLYAIDAADGTELWRRNLGANGRPVGAPSIAGETVYVAVRVRGQDPSRLLAFDTDGGRRWTVQTDIEPETTPVVADGRILLVQDFRMAVYG